MNFFLVLIEKTLSILFSSLIKKLAFFPEPTTSPIDLPGETSEVFILSARETTIHGYFLKSDLSNELLIYFHGNWGNIDLRLPELVNLRKLGVNVLGISYRGYGKSSGTPSERGIYQDGVSALNYAKKELGFSFENIIVMGRSLGSTVAIEVASKFPIKSLLLITPLTSGRCQLRVTGRKTLSFLVGDAFNNLRKVPKITCPVLLVHGSDDKITPKEMSVRLCGLIKGESHINIIENADHNNISTAYEAEYEKALKVFLG